jgi:succinate dehydrogenase/fumarate reductase flavoprotein subunit
MHYEELTREYAPRWPYSVRYGKENEVSCDVLVLGGGIAGCWAAISAAKKGVRVALVEKAATKTSGSGGFGVDHWHAAVTNPACKITPEEYTQANIDNLDGWKNGICQYIASRESYDCLLELEKIGVKIRDSEDEFKGAEFRDEKTKLMFAYDYTAKHCVRVWGANVKNSLYRECLRLGVIIFDRIMVTSLLTEGSKQGAKVIGATGINSRTGEFYIFKGKASVISMNRPRRQWVFSTELKALSAISGTPNLSGDGHVIAWKAGAEFTAMEGSSSAHGGPYSYPQYGAGNAGNTWYACSMVDANGKEIPWIDRDGKILKTVSERYRPAPGQKFFIAGRGGKYEYSGPALIPDWQQKARKGEYTLPFYSDLPSMPEMERKVLWRVMVAQEGRGLIPIYRTYAQAGFDPDKDLLQSYENGWGGPRLPQWRDTSCGGLVVDWDLKTSLDGLYVAGEQMFSPGDHAYAAATGRYAGRKAADYAAGSKESNIDRGRIEAEKIRVYAPLQRERGVDWKELNAGICRVMQDYCGETKNEELLKIGLKWFDEIEAGEANTALARNPHELLRLLEVFNIITVGRIIMESCLARKASNSILGLTRSDYREDNPTEWKKWITIKMVDGQIKTGTLPLDYYGNLKENYDSHCGLKC